MAAVLGGALLAVKGLGLELFDVDLSLVPPAMVLLALGLVGLHARCAARAGRLGQVGLLLAYAALAAALVTLVNLVAFERDLAPEGPDDCPLAVEVAEGVAFLGVFLGLLLLGLAALRAKGGHPLGRAVPLAIGLLWFPLMGATWFLGEGLVVSGLAWVLLGYAVWSGKPVAAGLPTPPRAPSEGITGRAA